MRIFALCAVALNFVLVNAVLTTSGAVLTPTRTIVRRENDSRNQNTSFVHTRDGEFRLGDDPFYFFGTSAYWLASLTNEDDIVRTIDSIAALGIRVIRTWAFNDVDTPPTDNSTWFQLIRNDTIIINDGPTGLQRLERVVREADARGIKVFMVLTNNFFPERTQNVAPDNGTNTIESLIRRQQGDVPTTLLPRNYLSNDYGGMDAYVRAFRGANGTHDEFYTNETIKNAFKDYIATVVTQFADSPSVFGFELANDPRCNSTLPASPSCDAHTITLWHDEISRFIKALAPNHVVASGDGGYFCVDCPKLFATPAPPEPSPAPGERRRGLPLTKSRVLARRAAKERARALEKRRKQGTTLRKDGKRIRGAWSAPAAIFKKKRQAQDNLGGTHDGSQGVDTEDIIAIPTIDYGTFQLFPDQLQLTAPDDVDTDDPVGQAIQAGVDWIEEHAESARRAGKPLALTGFGLVPANFSDQYVPFNNVSSQNFAPDFIYPTLGANGTQQASAYEIWIQAAIEAAIGGIIQYQWGQTNLTEQTGTVAIPNAETESPQEPATVVSPQDGYAVYSDVLHQIFASGASQQNAKDSSSPVS